jgi:phosphatidylglycerophosphate synthase
MNGAAIPTLHEFFARWQVQHNAPDLDPRDTTALRLFLTCTYYLAKPFARRRISPNVVTLFGLALSGLVLLAARRAPAIAGLLVLLSSLTDGVDGAVAALTDRATRIGFVLDSAVDRISDACFVLALRLCGAPWWICVSAICTNWFLEYVRARAGNAGLGEIGVVTVGERPTRVLGTGLSLVLFQVLGRSHEWPLTLGAAIVTVACVIGTIQLAWFLKGALSEHSATAK